MDIEVVQAAAAAAAVIALAKESINTGMDMPPAMVMVMATVMVTMVTALTPISTMNFIDL